MKIEIALPKEKGRCQILNIHTRKMRANSKMGEDVNLEELAGITKNFSGAELEGLVRAAQSCALNRLVKAASKVKTTRILGQCFTCTVRPREWGVETFHK